MTASSDPVLVTGAEDPMTHPPTTHEPRRLADERYRARPLGTAGWRSPSTCSTTGLPSRRATAASRASRSATARRALTSTATSSRLWRKSASRSRSEPSRSTSATARPWRGPDPRQLRRSGGDSLLADPELHHACWTSFARALSESKARSTCSGTASTSPTPATRAACSWPRARRPRHRRGLLARGDRLRFWPGDDRRTPYPAFCSYAAPEANGLREHPLEPADAAWQDKGARSLAVLAYDAMRAESDPNRTLLAFYESAYRAGARNAGWDIDALAHSAA